MASFLIPMIRHAEGTAVWYRLEDGRYAPPVDEWDNPMGPSTPFVRVHEYRVLSETPKGVWLETWTRADGKRFVLRSARKRWACPTLEEAIDSWRARKQRQLRLLERQASHVRQCLALQELEAFR